jgi:predicted helicase
MSKAEIYYKDIGDYLSREEKLKIVSENRSMLNPALKMVRVKPNKHGDWINKRNSRFEEFIPMESLKKFDSKSQSFFSTYAIGVSTNRDAWVYNFSESSLKNNMKKMISFYNEQRKLVENRRKDNQKINIENYLDTDPRKISWTVNLKKDIENNTVHKFDENFLRIGLYRPFVYMNLFFDTSFIERPGIWSQLLPIENNDNVIICVSCVGTNNGLSVLICEQIPNLHFIGDTQCFPLYWYEKKEKVQGNLFERVEDEYTRRDAISDFILDQAKTRYGSKVTKEDIFYYVYGILHSPDYRKTFANDLKKMLPRLPLVEKQSNFQVFSEAGKALAKIHLEYEDQKPPKEVLINNKPIPKAPFPDNQLAVEKMTFPAKNQKGTIIYNPYLTISNIPAKAYEYIVNGKSAVEWVMERYAITIHKESGIKNDPNDWAREHENPQYILDLLLSVITVSIKTVDIVAGLPKVEWG